MDKIGIVVFAVLFVIFISCLMALPVMLAWNYVMPTVFGLVKITWGQAWCLIFLANTFFKSTQNNTNN